MHVAGAAGVQTVLTSEWIRTKQTVEPLASELAIQHRELSSTAALVDALAAGSEGAVVLVAGHSNTVPEMIGALTGLAPVLATIPAGEFDNLYVVSVVGRGEGSFVRLKYGARSLLIRSSRHCRPGLQIGRP